jgi:hypothetical protein
MTLVEGGARADFNAIVDAFGGLRTLEQVQAGQGTLWRGWKSQHGDYAGADLLGTALLEDPSITVRIRFARGSVIAHHTWGPRRLLGFREVESMRRPRCSLKMLTITSRSTIGPDRSFA